MHFWPRLCPRPLKRFDEEGTGTEGKERKGKKSIYRAPFTVIHSKRSGVDHTVLPANNTMPAFPS